MWAPVSWTICSNSLYIKLLHFEEFLGHLGGGGGGVFSAVFWE